MAEAQAAARAGHEEEGAEGPAGRAAARAARLGLQAASTGYASLAGVAHHVSAPCLTTLHPDCVPWQCMHFFAKGLQAAPAVSFPTAKYTDGLQSAKVMCAARVKVCIRNFCAALQMHSAATGLEAETVY